VTISQPEYITAEELSDRLKQEVLSLEGDDLNWWTDHRITPFVARYGYLSHFIVGATGKNVIFFADDEDEFGVAKLGETCDVIRDYSLVGDLQNAVRNIQEFAV
jgi:hypothetical protein